MGDVKIIPLQRSFLEKHGIYFSPSTLRNWRRQGKYPGLVKKIGGKNFIDLERWEQICKQ